MKTTPSRGGHSETPEKPLRPLTLSLLATPLLLAAMAASAAAGPEPRGVILFNADKDGDQEIYSMNADGSGMRQLTFNKIRDDSARWSPDGKKIAFVRGGGEIWTMSATGAGQQFLFKGTSPAFSPDGRKLAFCASGTLRVYDFASKQTVAKVAASVYAGYNDQPDWSPNGLAIAYTQKFLYSLPHVKNIAVFNAGGALNNKRLTNYSDIKEGYASQPRWSPSGKEILYTVDLDQLYPLVPWFGPTYANSFVALMQANGQSQKSLIEPKGGSLSSPVWSPDGGYIAAAYQSPGAKARILRASKDASAAKWLTGAAYNSQPTDWRKFK